MPFAKLKTVNMYFETHGDGHPLILISGIGEDHSIWEGVIQTFAKHYKVVVFDNRGVGQTTTLSPPYTIAYMAEDIAALMDALHIDQAHILGHSMGGAIAQQLCLDYPEKVDKLILLATIAKLPIPSMMQLQLALKMGSMGVDHTILVESSIPWLFASKFLSNQENVQQVIQKKLNVEHPQKPEGFMGQVAALCEFDVKGKLGKIKKETLIMGGYEDICTPHMCSEYLHDSISKSKIELLQGVGHMIQIEAPNVFIDKVLDFLQ